MNLIKYLSDHKPLVHTILLAIQALSPILMLIGIRNGWEAAIYIGLTAVVISNLTAILTK